MKILVYSDSHNNNTAIEKMKSIVDEYDKILFLGDGISDFKHITKNFKGEAFAVLGNCDYSLEYPNERVVEFGGIKIMMCHGHQYNVKMTQNTILYKGEELGVDIILHGHSHIQFLKNYDNIYLMNPGSVSHSYGIGKRGYGVIEINNNKIQDIYLKKLDD